MIKTTPRYTLYGAQTSGYAEFAASIERQAAGPDRKALFWRLRDWLLGPGPASRAYIRYAYPAPNDVPSGPVTPGCADGGTITRERVQAAELDVAVSCSQAATLVLKMTYHPNWRVTVDGREQPIFMVSPGYIGVELTAGPHLVHAEYDAGYLKYALFAIGALLLAALVLLRHRIAALDARLFRQRRGALQETNGRETRGAKHS